MVGLVIEMPLALRSVVCVRESGQKQERAGTGRGWWGSATYLTSGEEGGEGSTKVLRGKGMVYLIRYVTPGDVFFNAS